MERLERKALIRALGWDAELERIRRGLPRLSLGGPLQPYQHRRVWDMGVSMTLAACPCAPYSVSYSTFSKRHTEGRKDGAQDGSSQPVLFCVPESGADLLRHYTLSDEGLENVNASAPAL